MKIKIPYKITNYIIKEFLVSLFAVFFIFLAIALLINFVEEISFFKEKKLDNLMFTVFFLALSKTPNTIIELSIFIFLFSGIVFFVKIEKNNEINTILLSGISKLLPILVTAFLSFFIGLLIIFLLSPASSASLKYYENAKRIFSSNENLIVINNTGLWFMENISNGYNIIRADKISNNEFNNLKNVTIYNLDSEFNFKKRYDGKEVFINKKNWKIENVTVLDSENEVNFNSKNNFSNLNFVSSIDINNLKNFFSNSDTVSFWQITKNIKNLNDRGYSADELKIKFHKYLSLPIYLFSIILLSTIFTIRIKKDYGMLIYIFIGTIAAFIIYFLNDLSIAIGLSNKLPLSLSVWSPIMIIIFLSSINLIKIYDK